MKIWIPILLSLLITGTSCGQSSGKGSKDGCFDPQTKVANDRCLLEYAELGGNAFYCNENGTRNPNGRSVFVWYTHNEGKRVPTKALFKLKNIEKLLMYPDRVGALRIDGPILFDDDLKGIDKMEGLQQLLISGEFSNAALDHLSELTELKNLWICDSPRLADSGGRYENPLWRKQCQAMENAHAGLFQKSSSVMRS
ncbi:hypothetical protein, partial [Mariniblastus fucicola]